MGQNILIFNTVKLFQLPQQLPKRSILSIRYILIVKADNLDTYGDIVKRGLPIPHASSRMGGYFSTVNNSIHLTGGSNEIMSFSVTADFVKRSFKSAFGGMQDNIFCF
jgi:hypothetical protein